MLLKAQLNQQLVEENRRRGGSIEGGPSEEMEHAKPAKRPGWRVLSFKDELNNMTEEDGDNRRRNTSRINNKHKHSHFYRTLTVTQSDPVRVCPCHTYTEMVQQIHVLPPYIPVSVAHPLCCVCLLLQDSCLCTTAAPGADPSHLNASDIYLDCTTAGGGGRGVSRWCASSRCRFPMMTPLPIWDALTSRAMFCSGNHVLKMFVAYVLVCEWNGAVSALGPKTLAGLSLCLLNGACLREMSV